MAAPILHTSHLTIGYHRGKNDTYQVCADINLGLQVGELVCLLGPNGSGKSTLLRTLAGIQPPLSGQVCLNDQNIARMSSKDLAYLLSIVLTESIITGILSVFSVTALGRIPHTNWLGKLTPQDQEQVMWALAQVGMQQFINRPITQLSDGEKQRVMIAKALAQDTPVIILDEPTVHLDLPGRVDTMRLLRKLAKETQKAILLSTHELDLALQVADTIWLMQEEKPLQIGAPEDLVLNGVVKDVFVNEAFDFDMHTGHFQMNQPIRGSIGFAGDGVIGFWTKKALTREGYEVLPLADQEVTVRVAGAKRHWILQIDDRSWELSTIKDLIEHLKTAATEEKPH